jgi:hypothetical protein
VSEWTSPLYRFDPERLGVMVFFGRTSTVMSAGATYQVAEPPTVAAMVPVEQVPEMVRVNVKVVVAPVIDAFGEGEKTTTDEGEPEHKKVGVKSSVADPGTVPAVYVSVRVWPLKYTKLLEIAVSWTKSLIVKLNVVVVAPKFVGPATVKVSVLAPAVDVDIRKSPIRTDAPALKVIDETLKEMPDPDAVTTTLPPTGAVGSVTRNGKAFAVPT